MRWFIEAIRNWLIEAEEAKRFQEAEERFWKMCAENDALNPIEHEQTK